MTIKRDIIREIKKQSLCREIKHLTDTVKSIRNNDPNSSEDDINIQAYRKVIAEKKIELENI
jgi:hypothetical protein